MKIKYTIGLLICVFNFVSGQFNFDSIISKSTLLKELCSNSKKYRIQIIYTPVKNGVPADKSYIFSQNPEYIYCASLVKLPISILAVEKLNELHIPLNATMLTDSCIKCHRTYLIDTTSKSKKPSVEHYIKKMFLVSDNEAYSRVYEFVGVDEVHQKLKQYGYPDTRIINRYDGSCSGLDNGITNPVKFYSTNGDLIYTQPCKYAKLQFSHPLGQVSVGKAYYNSKNKLINQPKEFTFMNHMPLNEIHAMLQELIYNQLKRFKLSKEQRQFLLDYLTMLPSESKLPLYNPKKFYDSYKKYLIYGDTKKIKNYNVKMTNIVGQSYGFMVDCARIKDDKNKIEFMLTASIYTNADEVINDGKYEYNSVALPFFAELGKCFYNYELTHKLLIKE
jgi:hypothetical protein